MDQGRLFKCACGGAALEAHGITSKGVLPSNTPLVLQCWHTRTICIEIILCLSSRGTLYCLLPPLRDERKARPLLQIQVATITRHGPYCWSQAPLSASSRCRCLPMIPCHWHPLAACQEERRASISSQRKQLGKNSSWTIANAQLKIIIIMHFYSFSRSWS